MKHQRLSLDYWRMIVSTISYFVLILLVWVFLRLLIACFLLPRHLANDEHADDLVETKDKTDVIRVTGADEPVSETDGCTGLSQQCPTPTVKVENVDGGLLVFGVLIGPNCQLALPAFGCIFLFIGFILTVVAYRGPSEDEDPSDYRNRLEVTNNVRTLGPVCIVVGLTMLTSGCFLRHLSRQAKIKQTRIGFYCPVHGDFYPLSPGISPKEFLFPEINRKRSWILPQCLKKRIPDIEPEENPIPNIPVCPHSIGSNRSSFDNQNVPLSYQTNFIIPPSVIISSGYLSTGTEKESISNFGSIRSFSIPNDVACFPNNYISHSSPPTTPSSPVHTSYNAEKRLSCPILPEIGIISSLKSEKSKISPILLSAKPEIRIVRPAVSETVSPKKLKPYSLTSCLSPRSCDEIKKRKTVSIILPKIETLPKQ